MRTLVFLLLEAFCVSQDTDRTLCYAPSGEECQKSIFHPSNYNCSSKLDDACQVSCNILAQKICFRSDNEPAKYEKCQREGKKALEKFSEGEVIELRFSELGDNPLRSTQSLTVFTARTSDSRSNNNSRKHNKEGI